MASCESPPLVGLANIYRTDKSIGPHGIGIILKELIIKLKMTKLKYSTLGAVS